MGRSKSRSKDRRNGSTYSASDLDRDLEVKVKEESLVIKEEHRDINVEHVEIKKETIEDRCKSRSDSRERSLSKDSRSRSLKWSKRSRSQIQINE